MKNKKVIMAIALLIGLFGLLFMSTYLYINDTNKKEANTRISVIVYGNNSNRWTTLKQGIDQAAKDFGAEINFCLMSSENDAKEQALLLEREIENGSKGIIIAVTDSKKMTESIQKASLKVPVVMVETKADNVDSLIYISADNYSMGLNIGRSVYLNNKEDYKVAVYVKSMQRNSVYERYQGFMDSLQYAENAITDWKLEAEDDPAQYLQKMIKEDPVDVIVALDDMSLEEVMDAVQSASIPVDVYGIGSTNKVVHNLDYGVINSIVFQNEFNMGYLSLQELLRSTHHEDNIPEIEVEFRTVNRETMYLPKNQRLVFPIVQ
jgi:ribose transport system substrate-binding protein